MLALLCHFLLTVLTTVNISIQISDGGSSVVNNGEPSGVRSASQELTSNLNFWRFEWRRKPSMKSETSFTLPEPAKFTDSRKSSILLSVALNHQRGLPNAEFRCSC